MSSYNNNNNSNLSYDNNSMLTNADITNHSLVTKIKTGILVVLIMALHRICHQYIRGVINNKPTGQKTCLADITIFTSQLVEIMTYLLLLPFIIRVMYGPPLPHILVIIFYFLHESLHVAIMTNLVCYVIFRYALLLFFHTINNILDETILMTLKLVTIGAGLILVLVEILWKINTDRYFVSKIVFYLWLGGPDILNLRNHGPIGGVELTPLVPAVVATIIYMCFFITSKYLERSFQTTNFDWPIWIARGLSAFSLSTVSLIVVLVDKREVDDIYDWPKPSYFIICAIYFFIPINWIILNQNAREKIMRPLKKKKMKRKSRQIAVIS